MSVSPAYCCYTTLGNINFWFGTILADLFHQQSCLNDIELNAGVRDVSSTCAITVMLTSSSKAVSQHADVCIRQLSYCSVKLLSLLVQAYDIQLDFRG